MTSRALALVLALFAFGCAGTLPKITTLPAQVAATDANVKNAAGNLLTIIVKADAVVDTVSKIEDQASTGGVVPANADAIFDTAIRGYVTAANTAVTAIKNGAVNSWPQLKALVDPVLSSAQRLINVAQDIGAIKSKVKAWLAQLRDGLSTAAGEFLIAKNFGGGR